ncbi:hypothetical protein FO519_004769 [Halicephalobus sp. NKZ332]|nr:hypothetical protein FO519_004769 [Halicephalobus sp. NKZ332]
MGKTEQQLKILLTVPNVAYSHVSFQGQLADILAQEGHYVRLAVHELRPISKVNVKHANVTFVHSSVANVEKSLQQDIIQAAFLNKTAYDDQALKLFGQSMAVMCKDVLSNNEYKNLLKEEHFDVAIGAEVDQCSLVLFKMLGIEAVILTSPMPLHDQEENIFGIPILRSYNTYIFNGDSSAPNLSFWKRLKAVYREFTGVVFGGDYILEATQTLLDKEYGRGQYDLRQMTREWLHQTSILAHPKTKAFITHGGRNSLIEAIKFAVPTISCPLFADQQYNSAVFQHHEIGVTLDIALLSEENVIKALKRVLYNPRIRENSYVLKKKLEVFPYSPKQKFIDWVNYVARFKQFSEFDLPGATMNAIQLYNLDVYASLVFASISLISVLIFIARHMISSATLLIHSLISVRKLKIT